MSSKVLVVGAGLAGCEAAHFLANNGIKVVLVESKRVQPNPSQKLKDFAELVCTNSLKSMREMSGHGLLKLEMKALNSLVLECAAEAKVPAGDALAVDRGLFSSAMTKKLEQHENIEIIHEEVVDPNITKEKFNCNYVIIATGPLTLEKLSEWIAINSSRDDLYFYDAIAPVVDADSLDYSKLYFKDRHIKETDSADYLNAPMNEEQYYEFVQALVDADKVPAQNFEKYQFFEACLPVDLMAERGKDTARYSCMKPLGLERKGEDRPFAVIQLRKENLLGSAFNLVGFQNRLKYSEQVRVFKTIPGFENASFLHLGSVHRNTFINSHKLLNDDLSLKTSPEIYFAGQIVGVEGYTESASMGLYVGYQLLQKIKKKPIVKWPYYTAIGALVHYVRTNEKPSPSSINFGLLPVVKLSKDLLKASKDKKFIKKTIAVERAKLSFAQHMSSEGQGQLQ